MMSNKANKIPQPHLHETIDYKNKQHDSYSTIIQYQQIIKSLGTELAEYKNKMELMASEKNQQSNVDSLKAEITEYKSKFNAIQPEIIQYQQIIKSLGTELAEYKNRFSFAPQGVRKEDDISSLRAEISRLKRNLDSMIL